MGVVINGRVAWEVKPNTPKAFYHNGGWYMWDKDYNDYYWRLQK